jgi:hypothetical protein
MMLHRRRIAIALIVVLAGIVVAPKLPTME